MTTIPPQSLVDSYEMLVAFDNYALGSAGSTVFANQEDAGLEMGPEHLLTEDLDSAWRSDVLDFRRDDPYIEWTFGEPRAVDFVGLHRHNVRLPIKVEFFKSSSGGGDANAPVFDSGWIHPIIRAAMADFNWKDMPWNLGPNDRQLDDWQTRFRLNSFVQADQVYYGVTSVRITFDRSHATELVNSGLLPLEEMNYGKPYLQMAMPMITRAYRPRINMILGWDITYEDRTITRRTIGGSMRGIRRTGGRSFAFALPHLDRSEAFEELLTKWFRSRGVLARVFIWPEPSHRRFFYDQSMIATLTSIPPAAMERLEWPGASGFVVTETE